MYTILLADDDPAVRDIFSTFLTREEYRVNVVSGGKEGISLLKTIAADLVLLDIMMEPLDGWETLSAIKINPTTRTVPIIMLTGKLPTYHEIMRYGGWVEDYVMKPIDFKVLVNSLAAFFQRYGSWQQESGRLQKEGVEKALIDEYHQLGRALAICEKLRQRYGENWRTDDDDLRMRRERFSKVRVVLGLTEPGQEIPVQPEVTPAPG
jgi:two-component system OmpR family response regulator